MQEKCSDWVTRPENGALLAANVNLESGLATDFLNLFNEYIMLAELVADGSMDHDVLSDWLPIDYETHFARSGFEGADIVLACFRSLPCCVRHRFDDAVNILITLILTHQGAPDPPVQIMIDIKHNRDIVAAIISEPVSTDMDNSDDTQAAIDALFD